MSRLLLADMKNNHYSFNTDISACKLPRAYLLRRRELWRSSEDNLDFLLDFYLSQQYPKKKKKKITTTSNVLTPVCRHGDKVSIGGHTNLVHDVDPFVEQRHQRVVEQQQDKGVNKVGPADVRVQAESMRF